MIPDCLDGLKHFVNIADGSAEQLRALLDFALAQKRRLSAGDPLDPRLDGRTLAMIFQKPSLRTRLSFETAMTQLGGHAINLDDHHIRLGQREAVCDIARVISGMCDGIMARVFEHAHVVEMAEYAAVPVVNALSDHSHPCQAMADVMTLMEHRGEPTGRHMVFVGDGNNVARSLATLCGRLGMRFTLATPPGYEFGEGFLAELGQIAPDMRLTVTADPAAAVCDADVVYADTWVSMGQEADKQQRLADFAGYQINAGLMAGAPAEALVMHCLPAYRGTEITDEVIDGPQSVVFEEAANRLHFQRALLQVLMRRR